MKKLMVVTPYFYPKIGGLENYAYNISLGLKRKYKWDIVVVTSNHEEKKYKEEKIKGMEIYRLPYWFKVSNTPINPIWYFQIKKIIKKENPDIINAHTPVPFISDITSRVRGKAKFILTYHNDLVKSNPLLSFITKTYYIFMGNKTLSLSDKIITTSPLYRDKSLYLKKYKNKVEIVPPGVDLKMFNPKNLDPKIKKQYAKSKNVLFVGSLEKTHNHKGLDYLIKAMKDVIKKIPKAKLLVVGSGDNLDYFKKIVKENQLEKFVDFVGRVEDKKLPSYYNASNVTVLPSTNDSEGFGMVLLEAGIYKKPVIGTKVGGIPYIIKDKETGLLIEPKNLIKLIDSINKLLSEEKIAKIYGTNGYKKVMNNFSWDKHTINMQNILKLLEVKEVRI